MATRWNKMLLRWVGLGLLAVWGVRWALEGLPADWLAAEGGVAWPAHLAAEAMTAALCLWAAATGRTGRPGATPMARLVRPAGLLALGALVYGGVNGLAPGVYGNWWAVGVAAAQLITAVVLLVALVRDPAAKAAGPWWPGILLALVGLGMVGFWAIQVAVAGIMAEGLVGLTAFLGGMGLLFGRPGAVSLGLAGAGGVLYAAINSLGWAALNDLVLGAVFAGAALVMAVAAAGLWRPALGGAAPKRKAA